MASTSTSNSDSKKDYQIKCFSFTWNNYDKTENWESIIESFATNYCEDLFYSEEEAPKTKTPHLQGYFRLTDKKRLSTVNNLLENKVYLQQSKKCKLANFRYCSKTGLCWVYNKSSGFKGTIDTKTQKKIQKEVSKGHAKKSNPINRKSYHICVEMAKEGKFDSILQEYPHIYLQYENKLKSLFIDINKTQRLFLGNEYGPFFKNHFLWLWGKTGMGKSYYCNVVVDYLNAFYKELHKERNTIYKPLRVYYKNKNKWWDKYTNEEIVIIEEASPESFKLSAHYYKQWIDEYPFNPEIKGATLDYIRPKFIIITSNYSLKQCCSEDGKGLIYREEDYEPLNRRLMQIHLEKKELPEWPNFHKLALYENSIDLVKYNYKNDIQDKIKSMKFNEVIKEGKSLYLLYKLKRSNPDTETTENELSIQPKPKKQKQKQNQPEKEKSILSEEESTQSSTKTVETPNLNELFCPTPEYPTIMVWNKTNWNYTNIYCINCFKHISSGLFCKQCSTIENDIQGLAECRRCKQLHPCLVDAHCPRCTIYLKERYKHIFPESEDQLPSEPDYLYNEGKQPWYDSNNKSVKKNNIIEQNNLYFDSFNNIFYSKKHLQFIYSKLLKIYKNIKIINNTLNPLKNAYDQYKIDKIVLENENIINNFCLKHYKYYPIKRRWRTTDELSQISNENKCWYCQHNELNHCYCDGIKHYDNDYDFDIFQENN